MVVERWGRFLATGPLECRLFNGCRVVCDLREHIQRQLFFFGAYEPVESYLFQRLLAPGMCVIDAGANIGQYTLIAAAAVGPEGRVHAFEPVPSNVSRLQHHVAINGFDDRVRVNAIALWDEPNTLTLHLDARDRHDNATNFSVNEQGESIVTLDRPAVRLDDYAREQGLGRLDVIKLDVEGSELRALRGATELLRTFRPTLLIEINTAHSRAMGYSPEAISDLLEPLGYSMRIIGDSPSKCRPLATLRGLERANVLCTSQPLPEGFWHDWTLKEILTDFHKRRSATTVSRA